MNALHTYPDIVENIRHNDPELIRQYTKYVQKPADDIKQEPYYKNYLAYLPAFPLCISDELTATFDWSTFCRLCLGTWKLKTEIDFTPTFANANCHPFPEDAFAVCDMSLFLDGRSAPIVLSKERTFMVWQVLETAVQDQMRIAYKEVFYRKQGKKLADRKQTTIDHWAAQYNKWQSLRQQIIEVREREQYEQMLREELKKVLQNP